MSDRLRGHIECLALDIDSAVENGDLGEAMKRAELLAVIKTIAEHGSEKSIEAILDWCAKAVRESGWGHGWEGDQP